ncbi:MAG TPA: hypothetical protein VGG40_02615 [Solirubrobacterales bacterium]
MEVGGKPIPWHVARIYASQGFGRFLLARLLERGGGRAPDGRVPAGGGRGRVPRHADRRAGGGPGGGAHRRHLLPHLRDGAAEIDVGAKIDVGAEAELHRARGAAAMTLVVPDLLEREPLAGDATDGARRAFRHNRLWDCTDTDKDTVVRDDLWRSSEASWVAERVGAG